MKGRRGRRTSERQRILAARAAAAPVGVVAVLAYAKALFTTVVAARSFGKAFVWNQAFLPAIHLVEMS